MKISRTCLGTKKTSFEFRASFAVFGFAIAALMLMPFPMNGAQYYTNWAVAYFTNNMSQSGPLLDPDGDGELNVVEFAFGTNPTNTLVGGGITGCVQPLYGGVSGTNSVFQVEILEREGHQPGVQIDLYLSSRLVTNWFRPWWLRTTTNSLPSDPAGSVRELFTTRLPGTNVWFVRPKVQLFEGGAETANYYVATNGDNNWPGTFAQPYATLAKAASNAVVGNLVYLRGGRYAVSSKITFSKFGTVGQPIRIRAYPGETPVLDFSGQTGTGSGVDGISISGNYYWFYGLVITNAGHNSIAITSSNNIIERCVSLGARNTGFHITGGNGGTATPASNLFLNCDSIRNYDAVGHGQDADGFSAKWSIGLGNVFSGCRSWENSDDGWDLWMGSQPVLITNCWAFRQGTNVFGDTGWQGNGNGFKLGGSGTPAAHRLVGCLSFANKAWGVDQNNNAAGQTVNQNTVWNNVKGAINLNHLNTGGPLQSRHTLTNNVAIGTVIITNFSIQISNTWQVLTDVNTSDFLNTDSAPYTWAMAPRRDDGGLPENPFLRPVPTGRLVDKGATNNGSPFFGSAPDLGAYETTTW